MSNIAKYYNQIKAAFPTANDSDIMSIGKTTFEKVGQFLTDRSAIRQGAYECISVANEAMTFDDAVNATSVEELTTMVKSCGIADCYVAPCCEAVLNIMDRCLGRSTQAVWTEQNKKQNSIANNSPVAMPLSDIYASDTVSVLNGNAIPSAEAFGVNVDVVNPDLKVCITVAIMNFHTRLLPRILPTKSINQPNVQYVKDFLEAYDLSDMDAPRTSLIDLYTEPKFAANELKRIVPMKSNDEDGVYLVDDGILKFGVKANILKLSLIEDKPGYSKMNRTDLVAENVKMDEIFFKVGGELFSVKVPQYAARLTRMVNADDSALRNADIKFRVVLKKGAQLADGSVSSVMDNMVTNEAGESEGFVVDLNIKPTISLKFGDVDCLAGATASIRPLAGQEASASAQQVVDAGIELVGYTLDARFSEENVRKTSIAVWTHKQPFSYDIPIGRNYVFDYAIGQENADENATNLTKIIGIGQDDVALRTVCIRTLEDVADRLAQLGPISASDRQDYVGAKFVAGDKVKPTVFQGTLDFTALNTIRDSDRSGDIKQKAITFLNAATTKVLYDSLIMQQLNGSGVTFRCVTSMPVLGNILAQPHIHNHMDKEDARDLGDGIEYVLVLPNGVRIEFVTTTFKNMENRLVMWPIIKNNADSELNFATNWDYGTMVAHYTPSGEEAHHRLFANIRELPIVTNPVGLLIDIKGMEFVNDMAEDGVYVRPTFKVEGNIQTSGSVNVSGSVTTEGGETEGTPEP